MTQSLRPITEFPSGMSPAERAKAAIPILLVDDNPGKRLALRSILLPLGHQIVEAGSGQEALRCVMVQNFAVILIDVRMPIMNGFETASFIRQRRQSEMTPLVFITAHTPDEIGSEQYVEGAVDFIYAPVKPEELRAKVTVFANLFARAEELAEKSRELKESADQLRLLTESAPIGIFQTNSYNKYVYTNPRWTEITGISPEDAIGRDWYTILGSDQRASFAPGARIAGAHVAELSHRFPLDFHGTSRIVLVTSKAIPDAKGGISGWVGTVDDVTAEAGAETALADARDKATEASQLKSDFLANMSHEIRTPMNGVLGMTELLLETDLDDDQRDYAQTVRSSGEALLIIINDILDFSKVESGKYQIEDVPFDPPAIVQDTIDLLVGTAQAKGLELLAYCEKSVPTAVTGDPGRIRQVLTNLIGNAIKFTQRGEVVVSVSVAAESELETVVRFEVSDTGVGIDAEKLGMIFEPFFQADSSTSRRYGGTGLGLAISSRLVGLMGGSCGVSSRLGAGSAFWFTVCVHPDPEATELPLADDGLADVHVLVVDDSATQRRVLSQYLTDWGMTVETAPSGSEGLALLQAAAAQGHPFALALLDRSMPAGREWPQLLAAINSDPIVDVRLVSLTERGHGLPPEDAAMGVSTSASKPLHPRELRAKLRQALGLSVPDVPPSEAPPKAVPAHVIMNKGRLLLAEDNLVNQQVAIAMLLSGGYEVDSVLDGAAAVKAAAVFAYDAILMDCQMPELDGYEATAAIRAQEVGGRSTPIIAMTAGAQAEDRKRCLASGMDDYIAKPVGKAALLQLVERHVRESLDRAATPVHVCTAEAGVVAARD